MKLYFASGNTHKKLEMSRLLGGYELTLPKEEGYTFDPDENGDSFIANAIIKAKALYDIVHQPVISDDSGLCVRALDWKPGIYTARYGNENGKVLTSVEKYMLLLKNMEGVKDRYAEFVCAICLYMGPNRIYVIQESAEGEIALAPSNGTEGFCYDPIFYNYEAKKIVADLNQGDKDLYSHRGKAARVMKTILDREMGK